MVGLESDHVLKWQSVMLPRMDRLGHLGPDERRMGLHRHRLDCGGDSDNYEIWHRIQKDGLSIVGPDQREPKRFCTLSASHRSLSTLMHSAGLA